MTVYGKERASLDLQPVSGKAMPVYRGEVLRITQLGDGQCVDFNCFNLHDYKEHMSVGHMRRQGFRLKKGHLVWSNPPRYRPMMTILEMPQNCITDLLHARCSATIFETSLGFDIHTNCQDTFAEAVGEYGLTPDDVHDSLNFWMNTGWDDEGITKVRKNTGKKGDYVDLLALMDVLAVPITCGSGDVQLTSNYFFKPVRLQVFEGSSETNSLMQSYINRFTGLKNQRSVESFRVKEIRTSRELKPTPGYQPKFVNYPITSHEIEIDLADEDYAALQLLKEQGEGNDDEDALRFAVLSWYSKNRGKRPLFWSHPL